MNKKSTYAKAKRLGIAAGALSMLMVGVPHPAWTQNSEAQIRARILENFQEGKRLNRIIPGYSLSLSKPPDCRVETHLKNDEIDRRTTASLKNIGKFEYRKNGVYLTCTDKTDCVARHSARPDGKDKKLDRTWQLVIWLNGVRLNGKIAEDLKALARLCRAN